MRRSISLHSKHVKISREGQEVLKNRQLTRKLVDAILDNIKELEEGGSVTVESNGQEISLSLAGETEHAKSA